MEQDDETFKINKGILNFLNKKEFAYEKNFYPGMNM